MNSEDALAIVIGHEMAHIENGDIDADLVHIEQTKHISPDRLAGLPVDAVMLDHTNMQELAADRKGPIFAMARSTDARAVAEADARIDRKQPLGISA
ncbi:MAG TPA: hypothetical protein VII69_13865 [Candidatus Eremiobacteraceae bacterium]